MNFCRNKDTNLWMRRANLENYHKTKMCPVLLDEHKSILDENEKSNYH